jgi:hypothetical protein
MHNIDYILCKLRSCWTFGSTMSKSTFIVDPVPERQHPTTSSSQC